MSAMQIGNERDGRPRCEPAALELTFTDDPARIPVERLKALMDATYWAAGRSPDVVARLLTGSYLVIGAFEERPGEPPHLVGFARAISDGVLHASVHDVIVDAGCRGRGLGRSIMETLLAHPAIAQIPSIGLSTLDRMSFYESLGFRRIGWTTAPFGTTVQMKLQRDQPSTMRNPAAVRPSSSSRAPRSS